jgi:teichuronic acid exporter
VVQVLLARLLLPEDFGLIAIVWVVVMLTQAFVNSGYGSALIQM